MLTYVILLRAVNVGSTGKLPMADFRKLLSGLGYAAIETYIQSGNAVVDAKGPASAVARAVGAALETLTGKRVPVIVRTHAELDRMVAANPFVKEASADGSRVFAVFFSAAPGDERSAELEPIVTNHPERRDRYHLAGDTLYLHLPDGAADSKFTAQTVDRVLGVTGTARNWNTVQKLHAMSKR